LCNTGRPPHAALHLAALHASKSTAATAAARRGDPFKGITSAAGAAGTAREGEDARRDALYGRASLGGGSRGATQSAAAAKLLQLFHRAQRGGVSSMRSEASLEEEVPLILARYFIIVDRLIQGLKVGAVTGDCCGVDGLG